MDYTFKAGQSFRTYTKRNAASNTKRRDVVIERPAHQGSRQGTPAETYKATVRGSKMSWWITVLPTTGICYLVGADSAERWHHCKGRYFIDI